ncbi:MAG: DNA primase [Bacteroidia bacterium]
MSRIPTHIVDQIYNATDIVEVISDYVQLKKRGANFWALSPFGNEKTPSFAVNPVKGIYKDFSSGKGGSAINFLMEMEGYTYAEALRHLARKYNIEIAEEEETDAEKDARDQRQSLFIVNEYAAGYFHDILLKHPEGRQVGLSYFKERGLLDATIETFQLGYSLDAWDAFVQAALQQQYREQYLEELGLVSRSEKTGNLLDRFRGRVMFPIHNAVGKVVGFGGRILGDRKDVGKYINSSESAIYHKSEILYGLYQAKKHIRDADQCILTEGYLDVILLHQNGIRNVVASSGTALTVEQVRLIRRYTRRVLLIYDGDAAGIKAALRGIDLLLREEMDVRVLVLPGKHDPDSYVREVGAQGFLDFATQAAQDFLEFKIQTQSEGQNTRDPRFQTELIKSLAETVALIPDLVQRQMYVRHVAQRMDITEALMTHAVEEARRDVQRSEYREQRREQARQERQQPADPSPPLQVTYELEAQEREILRVLLNYHDKTLDDAPPNAPHEDADGNPIVYPQIPLLPLFEEELEGLAFDHPDHERLRQHIFTTYQQQGRVDVQALLDHPDLLLRKLVADLLMPAHDISPNWRKHGAYVTDLDADLMRAAEEPLYHYKSRKLDQLLLQCREQIKAAQAAGDEAALDRLLDSNVYLTRMRRELHQRLGLEGAIRGSDAQL